MQEKLTLSQAATRCKVSRQRIHQWLQHHNLLQACEHIPGPTGQTVLLLIPAELLKNFPTQMNV